MRQAKEAGRHFFMQPLPRGIRAYLVSVLEVEVKDDNAWGVAPIEENAVIFLKKGREGGARGRGEGGGASS